MANTLPRSTYFAFILYPDNSDHMEVYHYLELHQEQFHPVWILHESETSVEQVVDYDDDGNELSHPVVHEKKAHIHMLIKALKSTTCNSIIRSFGGHIDYCLNIYSPVSYIMYMVHDTFNSRGKKRYSVSELCGDKKLIKKAYSSQNKNFVELGEICNKVKDGETLVDIVRDVCLVASENPDADVVDAFKEFQYIIVAMCTEQRFSRNQAIYDDLVGYNRNKSRRLSL